jgi:hypothetical protein
MRIALAGEGQELDDEVPLSVAARALGMSYLQAYNALLVGRLQGRRLKGRWWVTAECLKSSPASQSTAGHSGRARGPKS